MKCFRCFSFVLFALLGVFFGSFIINQNDIYALDNITYTINSSNYTNVPYYFCDNSDSSLPDCSGYNYLVAYSNDSCSFSNPASIFYFQFYNSMITTNPTFNPQFYSMQLFEFPGYYGSPSRLGFSGSSYVSSFLTNDCEISVIVSENNPYVSGITPSGSIELTENGTYDVSQYAEAVVNVPETDCPPGTGGNYHEDLVAINNSIMICAATCLVIYFFYCIYRMIIKNSGVK